MRKYLSVLFVIVLSIGFVSQAEAITRVGSGYVLSDGQLTEFNEKINAERLNIFSIHSGNGLSLYRDKVDTGFTGSVLDNEDQSTDTGYILLQSGSNASGTAVIQTRRRGNYIAGATAIYGFGFHRNGNAPTGDQRMEVGALNTANGLGFGEDSNGSYLFWKNEGDTGRIYQQNWNEDTLDGDNDADNPSGFELDVQTGVTIETYINFYGEGPVIFKALVPDTDSNEFDFVTLHEISSEEMAIDEPNLPIKMKVENNGVASNLEYALGGRQFSILSGRYEPISRPGSESVYNYTLTVGQGEWEPIMSMKKEPSRNGLPNSLNIEFLGANVLTNQNVAFRVTYGGTTDINSYQGSPDNIPDDETGVWTYDQQDFTAGVANGGVILRDVAPSGNNVSGVASEESPIVIGDDIEVTLWARPLTTNNTTVTAFMKWQEFW